MGSVDTTLAVHETRSTEPTTSSMLEISSDQKEDRFKSNTDMYGDFDSPIKNKSRATRNAITPKLAAAFEHTEVTDR